MDVTFLTKGQIWGDHNRKGQLQVMKDYGTKTGLSDLAIVQGGLLGDSETIDGQRSGCVWSASSDGYGDVRFLDRDGGRNALEPQHDRLCGARPALPSSVTSSIKASEAKTTRKIGNVVVVKFGEYPQTIAFAGLEKQGKSAEADQKREALEQLWKADALQTTGKTYTFFLEKTASGELIKARLYLEYRYDGKRYVRVAPQLSDSDSVLVLSNGHTLKEGEPCWIEVQPIEWLKDPSGVWVAKQALFSGVPFDRNEEYDGNFEKTDMKHFLQNHFAKDMQVVHHKETEIGSQEPTKPAKTWEERFNSGESGWAQGLG